MMKTALIFVAASVTLAASVANAEETRIGVGVGPVGAGVTVGQSPSYEIWRAFLPFTALGYP